MKAAKPYPLKQPSANNSPSAQVSAPAVSGPGGMVPGTEPSGKTSRVEPAIGAEAPTQCREPAGCRIFLSLPLHALRGL